MIFTKSMGEMDAQGETAIAVPVVSKEESFVVRTLKLRVGDNSRKWLRHQAREVNQVWNYCNELSFKHFVRQRKFMSAFEMQKYLAGYGKAGGKLASSSFQQVAEEYCTRRKQFKKVKLRWRKSSGSERSLGWIPFKVGVSKLNPGLGQEPQADGISRLKPGEVAKRRPVYYELCGNGTLDAGEGRAFSRGNR